MSQPTITGELRKWHHDIDSAGNKVLVGQMYNDIHGIWDNGDAAVLHYKDLYESANFYLAVVNSNTCIKCPKDEEVPSANKKVNGDSGDVG